MAAVSRQTAVAERSLGIACGADTRLLFAGPPNAVTGAIPLINETDTKLKLRSIGFRSATLKGPAGLPLQEVPFYAMLYPGEQASIPVTISLDPSTPPGEHQFELTIGKQTVAADALVEEVIDLRSTPTQLTILADSATTYTRRFIAENAGNVDIYGGAECKVPLFDTEDVTSAVLAGINESDRSTVEAMIKNVLLHIGDLQAGTVITRRDPVTLHPGEKIAADAHFELPPELKPLKHYRGDLQFFNTPLVLDIYTTASYGRKPATRRKAKESADGR